jgi:hypothetical protein
LEPLLQKGEYAQAKARLLPSILLLPQNEQQEMMKEHDVTFHELMPDSHPIPLPAPTLAEMLNLLQKGPPKEPEFCAWAAWQKSIEYWEKIIRA